MRRVEAAELAWVAILAEAAVVDLALLRTGRLPLSTVCRRSLFGRTVALLLVVHLVASVPFDPLTAFGHYLDTRQVRGEAPAT